MEIPLTKDKDMTSDTNVPEPSAPSTDIAGMKTETYCMLLHLSQLLNFMSGGVPCLGIVAPIVLWAVSKDKNPQVDQHGKIVLNWIISFLIYGMVILPFCFILIGIPFLLTLVILIFVFPIIGAIKANEGVLWKYPLSIPFFK